MGKKLWLIAAGLMIMAGPAVAGDIFTLDMCFTGPDPGPGPITVNYYDDDKVDNPDKIEATCTFDWDGMSMGTPVCNPDPDHDGEMTIISAMSDGDEITVCFSVTGKDGKFSSGSSFEVMLGGESFWREIHTSCSQVLFYDNPYWAEPAGYFVLTDGVADGDCLMPGDYPTDCIEDDKLFWIAGDFCVPCSSPGQVTVTMYKKEEWDNPRGQATGYFNGSMLTGMVSDLKVLLWGAFTDNGSLCLQVESFGYRDDGKFDSETSWEIEVEGCGTFLLRKYHTSCSQPIVLYDPVPLMPGGTVTWTNLCGCDASTVPTENQSWGGIKALYR